jgi:hypothetical protein
MMWVCSVVRRHMRPQTHCTNQGEIYCKLVQLTLESSALLTELR